jgi:hypothetical protein
MLKCIIDTVYGRVGKEVKGSVVEIRIRSRCGNGKKGCLEKGSYQWALILLPTYSANDPNSCEISLHPDG